MNFGCWNLRGINKSTHHEEVVEFVTTSNITFMSCLEIEVKSINFLVISKKIRKIGIRFLIMNIM